jgi:hypothetical protein
LPYNRSDIERWFAEDLYVPSGYVRLSPWHESVTLARRYSVMVYPAMDESWVQEEGTADVGTGAFTTPRGRDEMYRARAAEVLSSGADGVYLYNLFNPNSPILDQIGKPDSLRHQLSRRSQIAGTGYRNEQFITIPTLDPHHPLTVYPGLTEGVEIGVYEDDAALLANARIELRLTMWTETVSDISVSCCGIALEIPNQKGKDLVCAINSSNLRFRRNRVVVRNIRTGEIVISDMRIEVRYTEQVATMDSPCRHAVKIQPTTFFTAVRYDAHHGYTLAMVNRLAPQSYRK